MEGVTRIGVSLEPELLNKFDKVIQKKGYVSRSEAIRDLVRDTLAENEWKNDKEYMCGIITIVYNHDASGLTDKITEIQHESLDTIYTTIHMHLDHDMCMEVIALEGELGILKKLTNDLGSIKGVLRCKLTMAAKSSGHLHYIGTRN